MRLESKPETQRTPELELAQNKSISTLWHARRQFACGRKRLLKSKPERKKMRLLKDE
jgi:hypothetical protein